MALAATTLCAMAQAANTKSHDSSKPSFWQHPPPDWFLGVERAATSSCTLDACGDPLAGRVFRRALAERSARCPLAAEAQSRFQQRTRTQQERSRRMVAEMIETCGDLPAEAVIAAPCDAPEIAP